MKSEIKRNGQDINTLVKDCKSIQELKEKIIPLVDNQKKQWAEKIKRIIDETGYTKTRFANLCGVSRMTIDKWCKGSIPQNRETFLRIGMVANYDMYQMNRLLQRYGRYPGLYSKSLEDCVCIYVLQQGDRTDNYEKYQYILARIKEHLVCVASEEQKNVATEEFNQKLAEIQNEDELEQFITENIAVFSTAYHRFYAKVKLYIKQNYMTYSRSINDMSQAQDWSSSLRQSVYAIINNKWYPTRNKIISLGLHLSMDEEQINDILSMAHMEELCAMNLFESVILFILNKAKSEHVFDINSECYDPDELCVFARKIISQIGIPEVSAFISELPGDDKEE